jgi:hypothetical protein
MHSQTFASGQARDWKTLYRAAIHETDKNLLPHRISEAENAVLNRGREILYEHSAIEEREQLDDALYSLRAYRNASVQFQKAA